MLFSQIHCLCNFFSSFGFALPLSFSCEQGSTAHAATCVVHAVVNVTDQTHEKIFLEIHPTDKTMLTVPALHACNLATGGGRQWMWLLIPQSNVRPAATFQPEMIASAADFVFGRRALVKLVIKAYPAACGGNDHLVIYLRQERTHSDLWLFVNVHHRCD